MSGKDTDARTSIASWTRVRQKFCTQEVRERPPVPYVVVDPSADKRNQSEVDAIQKAAKAACNLVVDWREADLDSWQWPSISEGETGSESDEAYKDGSGAWDLIVAGNILELMSLQRGGELVARIARGRRGDGVGVLLLATSASASTNPDLLELDRLPRRSVVLCCSFVACCSPEIKF
jgi:hypothetical protein